jgi:N-acetylneuraminate synthase
MSGNHNQSLDKALAIVEAAARTGAHALKVQTYTADTMTLDIDEGDFLINDKASLWKDFSLYRLYQKAHTPWEWHKPIFERCRELGIIVFSTPFDASAIDFLESLNVPAYKVASFENTDLPLIRKIAATGKPMIISCARNAGAKDIVLLKCTSSYPATPENSNISTIPHMQQLFGTHVGLSDHTLGIGVAVAGAAMGASVIEKHFTISREEGGVDSAFSLEPDEMKLLVEETERAWQSIGKVTYGATADEKKSLQFRRSLYIAEDMKAGDELTSENLRSIRPGYGLPPKFYDSLIGKHVNIDTKKGTPMKWELVG